MASKKKIRRRVLGASCILAALIVAGASFAWFSSSDEVTNQLTATADYGVSVVEDFTPPKDMTPGQEVNKDVAAVNTGSVGAFVRTSLVNEMAAIKRINATEALETAVSAGTTYFRLADGNISNSAMTGTVPNLDSAATPDGATKLYDLRVFGNPTTFNVPTGAIELNAIENFDTDGNKKANEVTTLMAGGQVLVQASTAVAPNEQTVRSGDSYNGNYAIIYTESDHDGKYYMNDGTAYYEVTKDNNGIYSVKSDTATALESSKISVAALTRDYSGTGEYKPTGDGLYIFKRSAGKFSGFYYKDNKFYALKDGTNLEVAITYDTNSNSVVSSVSNIKFLTEAAGTPGTWTMQFGESEDDASWTDTPGTGDNYLKATYHVTADAASTTRDVIFFVKLDNQWQTNWTYVRNDSVTNGAGYFYYNKKLDSGETSDKLVDSVKLASGMDKSNFIDMTYNLKVALDSVQVTKDDQGNETMTAVPDTWANHKADYNNDGVFNTEADGDGIIDAVQWSTT